MASAEGLTANDEFYNSYAATNTDMDMLHCDYIWPKSNSLDRNIYYQESIYGNVGTNALLTQITPSISKNWVANSNTYPLA